MSKKTSRGAPRRGTRRRPPVLDALPVHVLAIDASSHAVGWAYFCQGNLEACGVVTERSGNLVERLYRLSFGLVADISNHIAIHKDRINDTALICETASGLRRAEKTSPRTTAVLGFAQGFIAGRLCLGYGFGPLVLLPDNTWTKGKNKQKRQAIMIASEPVYAAFAPRDKGADAADAVGLGRYAIYMEEYRNV